MPSRTSRPYALLLLFLTCWCIRLEGTQVGYITRTSCGTVAHLSQKLWANDVNRLDPEDFTLNLQQQVPDKSLSDSASHKLFTNVNEHKLSGRTFQSFMSLMDNYYPVQGKREDVTRDELNENKAFLDAIMGTKVMDILFNFLKCKGIVNTRGDLLIVLTKIWFHSYPRSGSSFVNDTSGFEHVMVGEYKSKRRVNGFHNWISFYHKEKAGKLDYHGYVDTAEPDVIGASFTWNKRVKSLARFFVGVSPEFDLAIYTLCYLTHRNRRCPVSLNGHALNIKSFDKDGHIATAYVEM